jgi:hypothetical protein
LNPHDFRPWNEIKSKLEALDLVPVRLPVPPLPFCCRQAVAILGQIDRMKFVLKNYYP